jgi:hypothetical protein
MRSQTLQQPARGALHEREAIPSRERHRVNPLRELRRSEGLGQP